MKTGYKIAIDMDGVLSDFSRKVAEILQVAPVESLALMEKVDEASLDKRKMWGAINRYDAHTPFFYSLEKMRDADDLMGWVVRHFDHEDIFILTASGHSPKDAPAQKRRWIRKHIGDYRVEVVTKSSEKAEFATPTTILVDDRAKSIDPWLEAGGIGVLHTDSTSTINALKELLEL